MLTLVFSMLPMSMQGQSSADRLYAQGVEYMKTLDVVSQHKAISYFTKARVAYDSSSKKRLCSQQINICNSIIKKLQTAEGKTRANKKLPMQNAKSTHVNAKQAIDLGLSVLWAECNVGAESPWQVGDFMLGEMQKELCNRLIRMIMFQVLRIFAVHRMI